ncbi:hypothetical protein HAZT_HAZT008410 [Hyalella azteca]|uniref:Peptidase M13 C-terminal domain-containing protein n=1 Tax=Hyalella azteca TaxID=294128 RepID=A0A6A0HHE3_HYAAZ|nr:hypothetical protein HAZT_HAZT008410 [Hyalella azteca]
MRVVSASVLMVLLAATLAAAAPKNWSQFSVLDDQLSNAISKILVEPVGVQLEPSPINQAKWLYAQCIDEDAIESAGTTPLTVILAENGGCSTELDDLGAPTDKQQWFISPTTLTLMLRAGVQLHRLPCRHLTACFYRASNLQAINYCAIGQVMGHEITHGFDDQGSQNDIDGNAIPWWSNTTLQAFKEKAQCVIDQYESYTVPDIDYLLPGAHVNGIN